MRCGGGLWAFDIVQKAAPFMRDGDPGSAAAGLCGFLFQHVGYTSDTAGTLSIDPAPVPAPEGKIDWKAYRSDCDIIVINVDDASAKCVLGSPKGKEVHNLPLGGRQIEQR
jgi:hypothetical protein